MMKIIHEENYAELRAKAYPSPAEFADALYWKERGDDTKWIAYLSKCDEVKQRFPKPQN